MNLPQPISSAERTYDALKLAHTKFVARAESEADLPAWYLLTPAGQIRIKTIGTFDRFVQFTTPDGHIVLIAPEAVALVMQQLVPESDEDRFEIGFRWPARGDEAGDLRREGAAPGDGLTLAVAVVRARATLRGSVLLPRVSPIDERDSCNPNESQP